MSADDTKAGTHWFATCTAVAKDFVALLRDGALLLLAVLLVAFPARFNSILVDAGFKEGTIAGFKWQSTLVESNNALKEAQRTISQLQGKNDELLKTLSEANSKWTDPKLVQRVAQLEQENTTLKTATQGVQARVTDSIESSAPLLEKAVASAGKTVELPAHRADVTVGLQTLGVDDAERLALNDALRTQGYGLDPTTWSYPANQRPSWFAERSTVFYYAAVARPMAEELAQYMKSRTGQPFAVQRGSGLGVDPARKNLTFFVHYVKSR